MVFMVDQMGEWMEDPDHFRLFTNFSFLSAIPSSSQVKTHYQRVYTDMTPFYKSLLARDLRALVYSGDADMACNFLGSETFVEALNETVSD